jgi:hypothetical protein
VVPALAAAVRRASGARTVGVLAAVDAQSVKALASLGYSVINDLPFDDGADGATG